MRKISAEEHEKRYRLWEQGLNDVQIAAACNCGTQSVYHWRKVYGLKANTPAGFPKYEYIQNGTVIHGGKHISDYEDARRKKLHGMGWTDKMIAKECGVRPQLIKNWRTVRGIAENI